MKKIIILVTVFFAASMVSCNKDNITAKKIEGEWSITNIYIDDVEKGLYYPFLATEFSNPEDYKRNLVFSDIDGNIGQLTFKQSNIEVDNQNIKAVLDDLVDTDNVSFAISENGEVMETGLFNFQIDLNSEDLVLSFNGIGNKETKYECKKIN